MSPITPEQTADVLTLIAARDRRTVGKVDVMAWHEDIGDLSFEDARAAVALHFRQSTDWLMPKHVRDLVKKIRSERLEGFQYVPVPGDDNTGVYLKALREQRAAVADGLREPAPELEDGKSRPVGELLAADIFSAERALAEARATLRRKS